MKVVKIQDPASLETTLTSYLNNPEYANVFTVFFGTEDSKSGESWCPDCVFSNPVIKKNVSALSSVSVLLECSVTKLEWKDATNPHYYRTNLRFNVQRIPTLIAWSKTTSNELFRMVEDECNNVAKWNELKVKLET